MTHSPNTFFFEGAEKTLEIWFPATINGSLRAIPLDELHGLMDLAQCQIVSHIHNSHMDSYVLSESSMFIADRRIILKTCGTTRLMDTVERIIELAAQYANFDKVMNIFYSRKNFVRPDLQYARHRTFDAEINHLDQFFEDGNGYCLGSLKQDRWYLYTMNEPRGTVGRPDQTLELMMQDMNLDVMDIFNMNTCSNGAEATKLSGIDQLVPKGTHIDDKLFEPCGYSMNGLIPNTDEYVTIHITPEPEFSYVSFETNQRQECFFKQTCKVLDCFRPGRFLMTVFCNRESQDSLKSMTALWEEMIPGYKRVDLQILLLQEHTLVYAQYKKIEPVEPEPMVIPV